MASSLHFVLETRPIERIPAELVAAGYFVDDRPLRGSAAIIDWRLCGRVSQLLLDEKLCGERGEALLVPTTGALRSPRALLVGLGARDGYRITSIQDAMRDVISRVASLGLRHVALAPLGVARDDVPRHAPAIVGGAFEALESRPGNYVVTLCVSSGELDRSYAAFGAATQALARPEVSLGRAEAPQTAAVTGESGTPRGSESLPSPTR